MRSEPTAGSGGGSGSAAPVDETTTGGGRAAPGGGLAPVDRSAALAAGAPGIPRKFWYWALGVAAVLALGGSLLEHVLSSSGLNPTSTATTTTPSATATVPNEVSTGSAPPHASKSSLASYMGLTVLHPSRAPAVTLFDQAGNRVSLSAFRGRAVVLTFFDGNCNDICPIEGAELKAADGDLGLASSRVAFVTVNTDPRDSAVSGLADAVARSGLAATPNWTMLTGALPSLNRVWRSYGVTVNYEPSTGIVAHNDVMYFVDQRGDLRFRATPFADESRSGNYSLSPADVSRWGKGIASYATQTFAEGVKS
jgi:cytochrome oxidase Cu insertion factor (SCO1/SenC/PrrC family)